METMVRPPRTGMEAFNLMPEGTYCQLINDVLIMSPAPNIPHANLQNVIFNALYEYVKEHNLGKVYSPVVDVYLNERNVFQPDIFYISNERESIIQEKGIMGAPDLVMEILSKGSQSYDLNEKKAVYCNSGVNEYWVLDPKTKRSEGFVLENNQYTSVGVTTGQLTIRMFNLPITF